MKSITCFLSLCLLGGSAQAQQIHLAILQPGQPAPQGQVLTLTPELAAILDRHSPHPPIRPASSAVVINAPVEPNLPPPVGPTPAPGPAPMPGPTPVPVPVAPGPMPAPIQPIVVPVQPMPQPIVIIQPRCRLFGWR